MNVLFAAPPGLHADALAHWLGQMAPEVRVQRCTPSSTCMPSPSRDVRMLVVDIDASPRVDARRFTEAFRQAFPQASLVVMGSPAKLPFMMELVEATSGIYLPTNCEHEVALKILRASLGSPLPGDDGAQSQAVIPPAVPRRGSRTRHPYGLTSRELDVLDLACLGFSNLDIARRCSISVGVVKVHLHHAYVKLGVDGRVAAIRIVEHWDAIQSLHAGSDDGADALLHWLLPHMHHQLHRKGHTLFRKGDRGDSMYYVQRGVVELTELGISMSDGDLFGEIGVFAPSHERTASARCTMDTDLFTLTAEQTQRLCMEQPRFAYYVIRMLADRLSAERRCERAV